MAAPSSITHLLPPSPPRPNPSQRLLTPTTLPIPLLQTRAARACVHVHTALVLGWLGLRFGSLVRDPMDEMISGLIVLAVLQGMGCVLCLPGLGGWAATRDGDGKGTGKGGGGGSGVGSGSGVISSGSGSGSIRRRPAGMGKGGGVMASTGSAAGAGGSWRGRVMPTLISLILALALPPLPLTLLTLVLGAPLYPTSLLPYTLLLSTHASLLAFLPLFYTHGVSGPAWRDVLAAWLPFDEAGVWGGTVGCLVGGWVGAVPMALDWDREWQKWPITVLVGVYLGWAVGRIVTSGFGWGVGRRIDLSENEGKGGEKKGT